MRGEEYRREATTKQARNLRRRATDAENLLWQHLRGRRLQGTKFRRQRAVGPYLVDFYSPDAGLVIEIDGGGHLEQAAADQERTKYLEGYGLKVLRFWNDEVFKQTEAVLECIAAELRRSPSPRPSPLGGEGEVKEASGAYEPSCGMEMPPC